MQVAEGDFVLSHIVGRGMHEGELLGSRDECRPLTERPTERKAQPLVLGLNSALQRASTSAVWRDQS